MRVERTSHINGAFKGWAGRGAYELTDGSVWVQAQYLYHYQYMYRPKARVVNDGGRYYLEVEGMKDRVEVRSGSKDDLEEK